MRASQDGRRYTVYKTKERAGQNIYPGASFQRGQISLAHLSLAHRFPSEQQIKQVRAGLVLRWGTTREGPVLRFLFLSFFCFFSVSLR